MILCFSFRLTAQTKHELTTDVVEWLNGNPNLGYEIMPGPHLGFQFSIIYAFDSYFFSYYDSTLLKGVSSEDFIAHNMTLSLGAKYYFTRKHYGKGLYVGVNAFTTFQTYIDDQYYKRMMELRGKVYEDNRGINNIFLGPIVGYKWVIKQKVVVEPYYSLGVFFEYGFSSLESDVGLKVGYRFGKASNSVNTTPMTFEK